MIVFFVGNILNAWKVIVAEAHRKSSGLRICLQIDPDLTSLPWELICAPDLAFLGAGTDIALSRYVYLSSNREIKHIEGTIKILLVTSSPQGPLKNWIPKTYVDQLKTEIKSINNADITPDSIQLEFLENPTLEVFHAALNKQRPHVLHFLGHGFDNALAFANAEGKLDLVNDKQFALLFQGINNLMLVIISACSSAGNYKNVFSSGFGPALINRRIPAVIAMQYPDVKLGVVIKFSRSFYTALANGYAVDLAVNQARNYLSLDTDNSRGWSTPVLYTGTSRHDMLVWKPKPISIPIAPPIVASVSDYTIPSQEIKQCLDNLTKWIELSSHFQRLCGEVIRFAGSLELAKDSEINQRLKTGYLKRCWDDPNLEITRLSIKLSQYSTINSNEQFHFDSGNFTDKVSELSEIWKQVSEKIDEDLDQANSLIKDFLYKLDQSSGECISVVTRKIQDLNGLMLPVVSK